MKVILQGATGRLGSEIEELFLQKKIELVYARRTNLETDENFKNFMDDLEGKYIYLDVSLAQGTQSLCQAIEKLDPQNQAKIHAVIVGTTGHKGPEDEAIKKMSAQLPVCVVANFSKGIFLFDEILHATTSQGIPIYQLMEKLGFTAGLLDIHHDQKQDAPSGTAKMISGKIGLSEKAITSWRLGNVFGEHNLRATNSGEFLEIRHVATDRKLFAEGALDLAQNIYKSEVQPGLLNQRDFMTLK